MSKWRKRLVPPTRIERATNGLGNRCSIQLSYGGLLVLSYTYAMVRNPCFLGFGIAL